MPEVKHQPKEEWKNVKKPLVRSTYSGKCMAFQGVLLNIVATTYKMFKTNWITLQIQHDTVHDQQNL